MRPQGFHERSLARKLLQIGRKISEERKKVWLWFEGRSNPTPDDPIPDID